MVQDEMALCVAAMVRRLTAAGSPATDRAFELERQVRLLERAREEVQSREQWLDEEVANVMAWVRERWTEEEIDEATRLADFWQKGTADSKRGRKR